MSLLRLSTYENLSNSLLYCSLISPMLTEENNQGNYDNLVNLGCKLCEWVQVKQQVLLSATEAAEMILRVDEIIKCAPRQRQE